MAGSANEVILRALIAVGWSAVGTLTTCALSQGARAKRSTPQTRPTPRLIAEAVQKRPGIAADRSRDSSSATYFVVARPVPKSSTAKVPKTIHTKDSSPKSSAPSGRS
jgi:hypothetical protein